MLLELARTQSFDQFDSHRSQARGPLTKQTLAHCPVSQAILSNAKTSSQVDHIFGRDMLATLIPSSHVTMSEESVEMIQYEEHLHKSPGLKISSNCTGDILVYLCSKAQKKVI